jgi:hypothetical protein
MGEAERVEERNIRENLSTKACNLLFVPLESVHELFPPFSSTCGVRTDDIVRAELLFQRFQDLAASNENMG